MERKDFRFSGATNYAETYDKFLERIFSFQKREFAFGVERLNPSFSVERKVGIDGKFNKFCGDTVVFELDGSQKHFIKEYYIEPLYQVASDAFAEKLSEHTLHMTLHDLNASDMVEFIPERIFYDEIALTNMMREFYLGSHEIKMETTCVFNMVNTSMVLGLKPKTWDDYNKLMRLYQLIENVHSLPYPFTPHITLAYYNRVGFEGEKLRRIEQMVNELNRETFDITLSTDRLYYQKFTSMNEYFNIMNFN